MALANRNILRTPSALRSGALTGLAQVVLALAAAGAGALLAHKFGRTAETDGFLAAYGVYIVLVLAAQTFRMVVVPDLTLAATAFSLGLISSAPLTRRGLDPEAAGRHVVHAAWVSLSLVGAAAGVFALVGGRIVQFVLGDQYKGEVGRQLGHLVVYLSPWMVGWVGFAVTFPLVFVAGRRTALVPLALVGFIICI